MNILELTEYAPEALYCDNPGHNEPAQDKYNGGPGLFNESQSWGLWCREGVEWFEDEVRVRVGGLHFEWTWTGVRNVCSGSMFIDILFAFWLLDFSIYVLLIL